MIYILSEKEYIEEFKKHETLMKQLMEDPIHSFLLSVTGIYPRGFYISGNVYINNDAFYLNDFDKKLLIEHEKGHARGEKHTPFGVMSPHGHTRLLSCTLDPNHCGINLNEENK